MPLRMLGRVAAACAVVVGVVLLTFVLLHLAPGDPAVHLAGPGATAEQLQAVRHTLCLDQPLPRQLLAWLGRAATGDWGTSLATGRPVATMLGEAWPWTAGLVLLSLGLSYLLGIGLALLQAQGSARRDTLLSVLSVALFAVPAYWLAVVLVWVFSWRLGWLPAFGGTGVDADFLPAGARLLDLARHLALPLVTLTLIGVGGAARFVRGSLFDARREPFLVAARARGLTGRRLLFRHLLRNALGPVVTLLGLSLPALLSGTVFVEGVLAWPGVGRVLLLGVQARDYPVVMAAALVSAILVVLGTLLAEGLRAWVDPRVRDA